jgi:hypothetical protein
MLSVYTRHFEKCPHRDDIALRRCRCPKWIQGTPSEITSSFAPALSMVPQLADCAHAVNRRAI